MVQYSVQLNFSVNLEGVRMRREDKNKQKKVKTVTGGNICRPVPTVRIGMGVALLPSPVGVVWRRARVE